MKNWNEKYASEKEAGIVEHLPMIDALGHGAKAVAETAFNYVKGLGQDIANVAGHPGPHGTDAPAGTELKSMLDLAANAAGGMAIKKKAPAAIDALKNKLEQRRDQKATNKSWNSIQDSGILEDK